MKRISFLTKAEIHAVESAIKKAEKMTSGEIRVHIENTTEKPTLVRAKEVFLYLNMDVTRQKNAVLFYVAADNRTFAVIGDRGIDAVVPDTFWEDTKALVLHHFEKGAIKEGLIASIQKVGENLQHFFPYQKDDTNELPDDISIGK